MTRGPALSKRNWKAATTASATAATPAMARPAWRAAFGSAVGGQVTATPPSGWAPPSSRDTGSARVSAMNGARNSAKW